MNIYEKTIDLAQRGAGAVGTDILFWIGCGIVAAALLVGIIRLIFLKHLLPCICYFHRAVIFFAWLYLVFAYFVVSTKYTLTLSNLFVYMVYPVAVVIVMYAIAVLFFSYRYCKAKAIEKVDGVRAFSVKKIKEPKVRKKKTPKPDKETKIKGDDAELENQRKQLQKLKQQMEAETASPKNNKQEKDKPSVQREDKNETVDSAVDFFEETSVEIPVVKPIIAEHKEEPFPFVENEENRQDNISRLAEEIERRRQDNIKITDGMKENKFSGVAVETQNSAEPKVVARKITETVHIEQEEKPKMGFTAQTITERKVTDNSYTNKNVFASQTTTTTGQKTTDDILSALARLRQSMTEGKK